MLGFRVVNKEAVYQADEENLTCKVSDEALEAAAANEALAAAWTNICTGVQCPG